MLSGGKTFRLFIDTDHAAFGDDGAARGVEVARILRDVAARIETEGDIWDWYQTLFDVNGNDVGRAAFKPRNDGWPHEAGRRG